jgi:hypothetical protein
MITEETKGNIKKLISKRLDEYISQGIGMGAFESKTVTEIEDTFDLDGDTALEIFTDLIIEIELEE